MARRVLRPCRGGSCTIALASVTLVACVVPLSGCVALVGGLGASWHYDRNTAAFEKDNSERSEQGLPPLTREEWNAAREAKAASGNPPEPE